MKPIFKIFLLFIIFSGTWIASQKASAQVAVSFQVFYDDLSPYGSWVENPSYGYVWVPNVAPGFNPYSTNGHWIYTEYGWTWVSDYPWGWAPFHYGRWYHDPMYGAMWVPGNEWGPGWVTWRQSEGYYGWAPIEPGVSLSIAYSSGYSVPNERWTFVRGRDFDGRRNINNYYVDRSTNTTIINNTTVINNSRVDNSRNVTYNGGPDRTEVQKRVGKPITPVEVRENNKHEQRVSDNQMAIYKPQVEKENAEGRKAAPSKVSDMKDVKPAAQRNAEPQQQKANQPAGDKPAVQPVKQQKTQDLHNMQPKQPAQNQHGDQPVKTPPQQQHNSQPANQQQEKHQSGQPAGQQPAPQRHNSQPSNQQPPHDGQPVKHQSAPQQSGQPTNHQPMQQQQSSPPMQHQPMKQQSQPQPDGQPLKHQPAQQQPDRQQQPRQQKDQPVKEHQPQNDKPHGSPDSHQPSQQRQPDPPQNKKDDNQPH